jgi:O-methyltransferase
MTTLWNNNISGDYVEFGSYGAVTFRSAYEESRKLNFPVKLWAFDSFKGLPESMGDHPRWVPGGMAMSEAEFVATLDYHNIPRDEYTIVSGFYKDTIGKGVRAADGYCRDIALAYIDCDLYDSSVTVFDFLLPRIKHGMIIALDDYHCWWADGVAGERLAMLEAAAKIEKDFNFVPFMQYGWHGQSFFVESRRFLKKTRPRGHF